MKKVFFKAVLFLSVFIAPLCGLYGNEEVFFEGDFKYTVENSKAWIIAYYGRDGKNLIIPEKLGVYDVTSIGHAAFDYSYGLENIVIPDSIISIGSSTFSTCSSLEISRNHPDVFA